MKFDLRGVMVTGAAGGLGRAVALGLAEGGVPTYCLDANADALREPVALIAGLVLVAAVPWISTGFL